MPAGSSAARPLHYSVTIMTIHWLTVALMAIVVVLAWTWPHGPARDTSSQLFLHRSIGLAILALAVLRIVVRWHSAIPDEGAGLTPLEDVASRVTRWLLYAILLAMPVTGFLWATSRGASVDVFGLFAMPPLLPPSESLRSVVRAMHSLGQYAVYAVVGLHAAAALFHLIVRRDDVMARMLPGARLTRPPQPAAARPGAR